jgi:hypothetical protein
MKGGNVRTKQIKNISIFQLCPKPRSRLPAIEMFQVREDQQSKETLNIEEGMRGTFGTFSQMYQKQTHDINI